VNRFDSNVPPFIYNEKRLAPDSEQKEHAGDVAQDKAEDDSGEACRPALLILAADFRVIDLLTPSAHNGNRRSPARSTAGGSRYDAAKVVKMYNGQTWSVYWEPTSGPTTKGSMTPTKKHTRTMTAKEGREKEQVELSARHE
jgi:hypothetical protein